MHGSEAPSPWVTRFAGLVPPGGSVLDVACGAGRHARLFAARGCSVDAVDRDAALASIFADVPNVHFLAADIEARPWPYAGRRFDAVIVTNYLHRPLFPMLRDAVANDGTLLYETFARGNEAFGRPSNPAFLLEARELLEVFARDFFIVAYEDGLVESPRKARIQRLCARRGAAPENMRLDGVSDGLRG